ncbi:MAG TPA: PAS-domain containing protein, partial [Rhizomicrobium sp.]
GRAMVFLRLEDPAMDGEVNYRAILDVLPMPVWFRNRNLTLAWANRAFVTATNHTTLKDAIEADATLDSSERDMAQEAGKGDGIVSRKLCAVVKGQRRALEIKMSRLSNMNVVGTAIDVTEATQAEAMLQLNADAVADVVDRIETAIVIFGKDKRLVTCNKAYARMWGFTEEWLGAHPSFDDVIDRLRTERRLPDQRDFRAWKRDQLQLFEKADLCGDETWHLPVGGSVRVRTYPYLPGGIACLFEDITERLSMQVSYNMLAQMQRATLNTVDDGMVVFGPDGRLKLHNDAFVRLWRLSESELEGEPHITKVADLCVSHNGHDGIWNIVLEGVESAEPARYSEWGTVTRSDGRVLSLTLSRIPLGATLAVFADLTDIKRFESALKQKPSSAA